MFSSENSREDRKEFPKLKTAIRENLKTKNEEFDGQLGCT